MSMRSFIAACAGLALLVQGCSGPVRKDAVPESLTIEAQVPGLSGVRYRLTEIEAMAQEGADSVERERH